MENKKSSRANLSIFFSIVIVACVIFTVSVVTNLKNPQTLNSKAQERSESCYVTPNTVNVGQSYTIYGSGFKRDELVNILINDAQVTNSWNLKADASGNTLLTWHSNLKGTSIVRFSSSVGHKSETFASCTFQVN
jgi:hypothetical protein